MKIFVTGDEPLVAITKLIDGIFAQYLHGLDKCDPEYGFAVLEQNSIRLKKAIDAYIDLKLETSSHLIGTEYTDEDFELTVERDQAEICENGHVISIGKDNITEFKFCPDCGYKVIDACPKCNAPIEAAAKSLTPTRFAEIETPMYCGNCGTPYPWTERQLKADEELKLLEEELNP